MRRTSRSTSWRSSTNSPSSKPSSPRTRQPSRRPYSKPPKNYETTSRTSMTSSGPCATTSTGKPHCFDIPLCAATRSLFDALDGIDQVTDQTGAVQVNTDKLADLAPKLTALLPQTIATMKASRDLSLATYNSQKALYDQMQATNDTALAMGQSFDQAKNNDLFYLPPEAFQNPDFKRGLVMFLSPDGKSARMFITHESDPATVAGIGRVDSERK